ncbi:MAG: aminotransferase class IV [Rhodospirillales bacterium]|nr:aminotransferase class IV [Rhodospirillales bacterium]
MAGSQDIAPDPRNAEVRIWLNGRLCRREEALVSVFDAGFIAGDGVWEGLRLHRGRLLFLDAHLDRLFAGARAIALDIGMDRAAIAAALHETCRANGMEDGVHIRLMVTRGPKITPSQDPRQSLGKPTIAIVAEWKLPNPAVQQAGLKLATVSQRCTRADQFDMRLNSHSRLPLILALLQADQAGADEALMLDDAGFIASCNATNFFFVVGGVVCTSSGRSCFNGITRAKILDLCRAEGIAAAPGDYARLDLARAEEAFVTGTFAGITPVATIDGQRFAAPGPLTGRLMALYRARIDAEAAG